MADVPPEVKTIRSVDNELMHQTEQNGSAAHFSKRERRSGARDSGGHASRVLICCAIGLTCFLGAYMRMPVLPLFAAELGAGTTQIGLINAAFMLSAGLLAVPAGLLSDRIGIRPVLLAGLVLMSAASFLIPLSRGPLMLGAFYLVFGTGLSAFTPTMMASVAKATPRSHLGRAYSWYTTAVYISMTIGPAAGGLLGRVLGMKQVFLLSGALIFLALLGVIAFLPQETPHHSESHRAEEPGQRSTGLLGNRPLIAALVGTMGGCFGFGMFISFLPLHASSHGLDVQQVGIVFAAQALVNVLLRIPFGHLSDRVDRGMMSAIGLALCALGLGLTGISSTLVGLILSAALLGAGMGVSFTALSSLVVIVLPASQRGLGMGLYNSCIYLGMMLSSASMGALIHQSSFRTGFVVAGAATLLAAIVFSCLYRGAVANKRSF